MRGRSTTGNISFGMALVAGRKRVPSPATGKTALRMTVMGLAGAAESGGPCGCLNRVLRKARTRTPHATALRLRQWPLARCRRSLDLRDDDSSTMTFGENQSGAGPLVPQERPLRRPSKAQFNPALGFAV